MPSEKILCVDYNIDILRRCYERHRKSQSHLKNVNIRFKEFNELKEWATNNDICNYERLSKDRIKEIKNSFNSRKSEYNLHNEKKWKDIGNKLSIRNIGNLNREQLINRLNKIFSKPPRLGLISLKYIKQLAEKYSIDITNKRRKKLINEIYNN